MFTFGTKCKLKNMKKIIFIIGLILLTHLTFAQSIIATKDTICKGGSSTLTAMGVNASNFLWSPSNGLNATRGVSVIASPTETTTYSIIDTFVHWKKISASGASSSTSTTIAIRIDGTLWGWGFNGYGCVGDGTQIDRYSPVKIGQDSDWVNISSQGYHSFGLKKDGSLWGWGMNPVSYSLTPVKIGTDTDWVNISAGYSHCYGLKRNGSLWAWGYNVYGQLGLGDTLNRNTPVQVGTDTNWAVIAAGYHYFLGLKKNGTMWAFGWNGYGQLGDGTTTNRKTPFQVGTDNNWASVSGSDGHNVCLKKNGTLWIGGAGCFGGNFPYQVGNDSDWVMAQTNYGWDLALKKNGTIWTGSNTSFGTFNGVFQIGNDTDWVSISMGNLNAFAFKRNKTIWGWGWNQNGQLGDGTTLARERPILSGGIASKTITVISTDSIIVQPTDISGRKGSNKIISFTHSGTGNNYSWQTNPLGCGWQNVPNANQYSGAKTNSLSINGLTVSNHNQNFRVITSKSSCVDTSNIVKLIISDIADDSLSLKSANDSIRILNILYINKHDTVYVGSTITTDTLKISIRTGISSASPIINTLKVYPNPASKLLNIVLDKPGYYVAKLSSVNGQTIITPTSGTIDISNLANGVYILTIYDSNNKLISTNKVSIIN